MANLFEPKPKMKSSVLPLPTPNSNGLTPNSNGQTPSSNGQNSNFSFSNSPNTTRSFFTNIFSAKSSNKGSFSNTRKMPRASGFGFGSASAPASASASGSSSGSSSAANRPRYPSSPNTKRPTVVVGGKRTKRKTRVSRR